MRNYFTVTISDVHGSRHYSFKYFIRKFAWLILLIFLLIWGLGAVSLWWLTYQADQMERHNKQMVETYNQVLLKTKKDYEHLLQEKQNLEKDLDKKNAQVNFLDQSLQDLESLVGIDPEEPEKLPYKERVKLVQLNTLGKNLMLNMVPSGHPVSKYEGITSPFGYRIHPITGKREFHGGIDFRGPIGEPVHATAEGVVQYSAYSEKSGYGNLVTILHSNGFRTRYGHLSQRSVKEGDIVQKGQKIGEIGSTGRSTGPHLHYEVWFLHHRLNPLPFDKWTIKNYDGIFTKVKGVPWASLSQNVKKVVQKVEKQLLPKTVKSAAKSLN